MLLLDPAGRNHRWREGELYQALAARGYPVCAPDVRGIGDLAPEFGRGGPGYTRSHQSEEDYAWGSLILGRPLAGQRVTDILALVAGLRKHPALGARRVIVAARGKLTAPALFAAALDRDISGLYLGGGLASFRSIVDTESYDHTFANFIPDLLRHTDLPEVAASLAPRPLTLAGAVDAEGRALDIAAVKGLYGAEHISVRDKADWNLDTLSGWAG
jgi:hypothetical protein